MGGIESTPAKPRSKAGYWIAACALAAVLLYYSLRGIQWANVWQVLLRAKLIYVGMACALLTLALFLRAVRWRVLLRAAAPVDVPGAFWATAAGYFGNNFLPARAGELVRTMMISTRWGISKAFVLTTALSERICDAIVLIVITSVVLLILPEKPGWIEHAKVPFAIAGGSAECSVSPCCRHSKGCGTPFWKSSRCRIVFREKVTGRFRAYPARHPNLP